MLIKQIHGVGEQRSPQRCVLPYVWGRDEKFTFVTSKRVTRDQLSSPFPCCRASGQGHGET